MFKYYFIKLFTYIYVKFETQLNKNNYENPEI